MTGDPFLDVSTFTDDAKQTNVDDVRADAVSVAPAYIRKLVEQLKQSVRTGDDTTALNEVLSVLVRDSTPLQHFKQFVLLYGGKEKLLADLQGLLRNQFKYIISHLRRRLNDDRLLLEDIALIEETQRQQELQDYISKHFIIPGARIVSGLFILEPLKYFLDEVLGTAKDFYAEIADNLAEAGYPNLAAIVATLSDLLLPGSAFDVMLSMIPFGSAGGTCKVILDRIGKKALARSVAKRGISEAARESAEQISNELTSAIGKKLEQEINTLADKAIRGDQKALLELVELEETRNAITPTKHLLRQETREAQVVLHNTSKVMRPDLSELVRPPMGSTASSTLDESLDGFVQTIETTLKRSSGKRLSNASETAKNAGLRSIEGQNWAHIIPDVLEGDDAVYNLVRASERINKSYYSIIDQLRKQPIEDLQVKVRIFFKNAHDVAERHASKIEWQLPFPDPKHPQMIIFEDLESTPALTLSKLLMAVRRGYRAAAQGKNPSQQEAMDRVAQALLEPNTS